MALSSDEQDLFDEARAVLPPWFFSRERANEELGMMAKTVGASLTQVRDWLQVQVRILFAEGASSTTPDWLAQHAADRGSRRQSGESDAALRDRLRKFEHGLTRALLLNAVQSMLTTYGVVGSPAMVELPRDEAFFGTITAPFGTGGTFTAPVSSVMTFKPTVRFRARPWVRPFSLRDADGNTTGALTPASGRVLSWQITISGAANGGNNGTFVTTGLVGDAVQYTNASGVAAVDASASWTIKRKNWRGIVLDGRKNSFLSRGFRLGRTGAQIIIMLPYGTSEAVRKSIAEMARQKKGAGVILVVERRANP